MFLWSMAPVCRLAWSRREMRCGQDIVELERDMKRLEALEGSIGY
jgi:hypothetical protein